MRVRLAAALLAVFALAGCTQSTTSSDTNFAGEEQRVADAVGDLQDAGQNSKPADICDNLLAPVLKARMAAGTSSCADELKKAIEDTDGFDLEVTDVSVDGATATARVRSQNPGKDVVRTFELARRSGGWRFTSFG